MYIKTSIAVEFNAFWEARFFLMAHMTHKIIILTGQFRN